MTDYPYSTIYDSLTIAMERAAYDTIRYYAPETHIIFMSYPFTWKNYDFIQDIRKLEKILIGVMHPLGFMDMVFPQKIAEFLFKALRIQDTL